VIAVPGTLGFVIGGWGIPLLPAFSLGYVNWLEFLLIVPATLTLCRWERNWRIPRAKQAYDAPSHYFWE